MIDQASSHTEMPDFYCPQYSPRYVGLQMNHRTGSMLLPSEFRRRTTRLLAILCLGAVIGCTTAQTSTEHFEPMMAQKGKDVMWMPTANELVTEMLEMAQVNAFDVVYDLGSGDGKIPIEAARRYGAQSVGIEYNPNMAALARRNALQAGVSDRVTIITGDIFQEDFSHATVVTLYLLTELNLKLKAKLLNMKPGTRVASNTFAMGSWEPDALILSNGETSGYFWIVPAKVEGNWEFTGLPGIEQARLKILQKSQKFHGDLTLDTKNFQRIDGKLQGAQISFQYLAANGELQTFWGVASANTLHGTIKEVPGSVVTASKLP